jgi:hypothetical protein
VGGEAGTREAWGGGERRGEAHDEAAAPTSPRRLASARRRVEERKTN